MNVLYKTIASGFGSGYFPYGPGTMGTIVGCLMFWSAAKLLPTTPFHLFQIGFIVVILLTTIIGAFVTQQLESEWGEDPSKVVIDEIVGVWISLFWIPFNWQLLLSGFVLFRVFDIWKPLGIRKLEKIPNGWGVMLDDVAAGVYANLCLQIGSVLFYA